MIQVSIEVMEYFDEYWEERDVSVMTLVERQKGRRPLCVTLSADDIAAVVQVAYAHPEFRPLIEECVKNGNKQDE